MCNTCVFANIVHNGAKICFGVQILKFIYSEKATKAWYNDPLKGGLIPESFSFCDRIVILDIFGGWKTL